MCHETAAGPKGDRELAVLRRFDATLNLTGGFGGAVAVKDHLLAGNVQAGEVQLQGATLNQHGYLVDIVDVEAILSELANHYRDRMLNALPEFAGINPSIEHFARILCEAFVKRLKGGHLSAIQVKIWENRIAWASYVKEW